MYQNKMWELIGHRQLKIGMKENDSFLPFTWLRYARRHKRLLLSLSIILFGISYVFLPDIFGIFNGPARIDRYCRGISNSRNFCYLNSDLQLLSSSNQFIRYLNSINQLVTADSDIFQKSYKKSQAIISTGKPINYLHVQFSKFLYELNRLHFKRSTLSNYDFLKIINNFIPLNLYEQQDTHEILQILIDLLEKEYIEISKVLKDKNHPKIKIVDFPFNGKSLMQMKCLKCGNVSEPKKIDISVMSLILNERSHILQSLIRESQTSVLENYNCVGCKMNLLMEKMEKGEIGKTENDICFAKLKNIYNDNGKKIPINYEFEDSDQLECLNQYLSDYKGDSKVLKTEEFYELPKVLVIQISRGSYNSSNGALKNYNSLEFSEELVIDCTGNNIEKCGHKKKSDIELFELRSLIGHSGSHYYGHFQCIKKKPIITREKLMTGQDQNTRYYKYRVKQTPIDVNFFGNQDKEKATCEFEYKGNKIVYEDSQVFKKSKRRERVLDSVIENPYWRISDSDVYEVDKTALYNQRSNVYMLLYERK